ncbi:MAG TPA: hypothetical protein VJU18_19965 [Vicinamibacteria bacterium]|nr:hypothetical protein [Vicinamibacteria bacterium]
MPGELKVITVIVPQGEGMALLHALYEKKMLRASLGTARAPFTQVKRTGGLPRTVRHSVEKDILTVLVPTEKADEVFGFLHDAAKVGAQPGGFMFQGSLARASEFRLPDDLSPR